jgi:uncharacterized protein (TIGR03083 family)
VTLSREELLGIAAAEREALGRTMQYTPPEAWEAASGYDSWRNRDVVAHLAASDVAAAGVLAGEAPGELEEYLKSEDGRRNPTLDGFNDFTVRRRAETPFRQVVLEWGQAADLFLARASRVGDEDWAARRVPWVAGEIPVRFLIQGRVSEWWSHGEDIRKGAGLPARVEHWPIHALNDLAIRALPWALGLAGLSYRGRSVEVTLEGAGGGRWHYGLAPKEVPAEGRPPDARIGGRAPAFALVAARRVPAEEYVEGGQLVLGGDQELALAILRHIRVFS